MSSVSVVIPSFNQGHFIAETIDSVLSQTERALEILVMDGGSTDGTLDVLRGYGDRITWHSEPDRGVWQALNRGFLLAQGEIIGWLNSDDVYYQTGTLSLVKREFDRDLELDVLYGDVAVIGADSHLLRLRLLPDYGRERLERSNIISQPAVFLRRSVVREERLRPFLSLDYEYWIRLGRKGFRFKHTNSILAADRQYAGRASIHSRTRMDVEFRSYKREYGIPAEVHPLRRAMDRVGLAPFRFKGMYYVLNLLIDRSAHGRLAFPMLIDSPARLVWRQLFRSVLDIGLDGEVERSPPVGGPGA